MYRCQVCAAVSKPKQALRRHVIYRARADGRGDEVAREVPICEACEHELRTGISLAELCRCFAKPVYLPAPLPEPLPPSPAPYVPPKQERVSRFARPD